VARAHITASIAIRALTGTDLCLPLSPMTSSRWERSDLRQMIERCGSGHPPLSDLEPDRYRPVDSMSESGEPHPTLLAYIV